MLMQATAKKVSPNMVNYVSALEGSLRHPNHVAMKATIERNFLHNLVDVTAVQLIPKFQEKKGKS